MGKGVSTDDAAAPGALRAALDASFERYEGALKVAPISYQEDMHVNMCIRMAGYLERLFDAAVRDYVGGAVADGPARSFALSWWRRPPNMTPRALEDLVGRFGQDWVDDLSALLTHSDKTQLGNLLKVRNEAAHGISYAGSRPEVLTYKALLDRLDEWALRRFYASPKPINSSA